LRKDFFVSVVLDLSNTAHCRSATGVQRVARQLYAALAEIGAGPMAVVYDPYAKRWRGPDAAERALLAPDAAEGPAQNRREVWSVAQKARGYLRRGGEPDWAKLRGAPLLAPEIFSPAIFAAYAELRGKLGGSTAALFYDAVALRFPQLTPPANVARVENYLRELATLDGVAAISAASKDDLLEQWARLGVRDHPPVEAIPLGVSAPPIAPAPLSPDEARLGVLVLCVGSIEGRKNHRALLEAAELLWREGRHFRLILAGLPRRETAAVALGLAARLQSAGRPLQLTGAIPDQRLEELYVKCRFTVYPSLYEGYGLPVAESLLRLRPCICGTGGALAEAAAGGGCLTVTEPDAPSLAQAMRALLDDDAWHARLCAEAAQRRFPTWNDYARGLLAWLETLPKRAGG
jgi:glycosyltransferase involved in cell wall biosynthesis